MTEPESPDESDRHSVGLIIAAVLSWIPLLVVLIGTLTMHDLPARVPVHWSLDGTVDRWDSTAAGFWFDLPFGIAGGVLVTAIVIFGGNNISRLKGALGLAVIVLLSAGISGLWPASVAIARDGVGSQHAMGILMLCALILAVLVYASAALPRRAARAHVRDDKET